MDEAQEYELLRDETVPALVCMVLDLRRVLRALKRETAFMGADARTFAEAQMLCQEDQ